jgi:hypothetical protein
MSTSFKSLPFTAISPEDLVLRLFGLFDPLALAEPDAGAAPVLIESTGDSPARGRPNVGAFSCGVASCSLIL